MTIHKLVKTKYLFLIITLLSFNTGFSQSNCEAGFIYGMDHCPNIYFYDNSTADSSIVCWMFDYNGEGNIDWCENAHNKFDTNGVFEVCISIMTIDGCTDSFCDTIEINCVCEKPEAGFTISQTGNACNFTDTSLLYDLPNTTWFWDFGDGVTSTLENPSHTYATNGTFMACLTVTDTCKVSTICQTIEVNTAGLQAYEHNNVSVYPIPATDWVQVLTENANASMVEIYTMSGQILVRERVMQPSKPHYLNVSELENGHYYLRLIDDENNFSHHPVLIQH